MKVVIMTILAMLETIMITRKKYSFPTGRGANIPKLEISTRVELDVRREVCNHNEAMCEWVYRKKFFSLSGLGVWRVHSSPLINGKKRH